MKKHKRPRSPMWTLLSETSRKVPGYVCERHVVSTSTRGTPIYGCGQLDANFCDWHDNKRPQSHAYILGM